MREMLKEMCEDMRWLGTADRLSLDELSETDMYYLKEEIFHAICMAITESKERKLSKTE